MTEMDLLEYEQPKSSQQEFYKNERRSLYANILIEDLGAQVMPLNRRHCTKNTFRAYFEGEEPESKKFRELLLNIPRYHDHDITDYICDVVNSISSSITQNGSAYFEVLSSKKKNFNQFRLFQIYGKNIFSLKYGILQITRKVIEYDFEIKRGGHKFIWWKGKDFLIINIPKMLLNKSKYLMALSLLKKFGDSPNALLNLDSNGKFLDVGFDFSNAQKNIVLFRNVLTKKIGYDYRNSDGEYITEFYMVYRFITFKIAKTVLRDHIINELNMFADKLGIKSQIIIEGLPTQTSLLALQLKLQNSDISFSKAIDESSF